MSPAIAPAARSSWPLERVLFLIASAVLAAVVSPWFLLLTAFVGVNQLAFAATGTCGAAFILRRGFGLQGCGR